jgi:hypothetical protein
MWPEGMTVPYLLSRSAICRNASLNVLSIVLLSAMFRFRARSGRDYNLLIPPIVIEVRDGA